MTADQSRTLKLLADRVQYLEAVLEMHCNSEAIIELDGFGEQNIHGTGVPPVGMKFEAHKHTTDGGTFATFEVVGHEWELTDTFPNPDHSAALTCFVVRVKTRRCS